jgi:putative SOS response-associated peptidase YedK
MCNDYGHRVTYRDHVEAFGQRGLPLVSPPPEAAPNLAPRDEIWPTEAAPVIRPAPGGVALAQLRWGLAAARPKAPVIINLRSEGRSFARGRCLIPASHFYEFTGAKRPKRRWRVTRAGQDWFCIAGVLGRGRTAEGEEVEAFAMLTAAPGPDIAPYHDRQPVLVEPEDWAAWLDPAEPAAPFLRPSPAGSLQVADAPREAGPLLVAR